MTAFKEMKKKIDENAREEVVRRMAEDFSKAEKKKAEVKGELKYKGVKQEDWKERQQIKLENQRKLQAERLAKQEEIRKQRKIEKEKSRFPEEKMIKEERIRKEAEKAMIEKHKRELARARAQAEANKPRGQRAAERFIEWFKKVSGHAVKKKEVAPGKSTVEIEVSEKSGNGLSGKEEQEISRREKDRVQRMIERREAKLRAREEQAAAMERVERKLAQQKLNEIQAREKRKLALKMARMQAKQAGVTYSEPVQSEPQQEVIVKNQEMTVAPNGNEDLIFLESSSQRGLFGFEIPATNEELKNRAQTKFQILSSSFKNARYRGARNILTGKQARQPRHLIFGAGGKTANQSLIDQTVGDRAGARSSLIYGSETGKYKSLALGHDGHGTGNGGMLASAIRGSPSKVRLMFETSGKGNLKGLLFKKGNNKLGKLIRF